MATKDSNTCKVGMQKYWNEELNAEERASFYQHLENCPDCQAYYDETKKTVAFLQSASHMEAPPNFTEDVMKQLPSTPPVSPPRYKRWIKRHPLAAAAAVFILLMSSTVWGSWSAVGSQEVEVSGAGNFHIDRENGVVTVPEGEVITSDLTVRNGDLEVYGEVQGDATVIRGEQYLASAGHVSGEIEEVNEVVQWVWYQVRDLTVQLWPSSDENE
ncbi:anti-sigma factor family protein [Salsuginibacillus kocurii]|uniref:anti-sigma factor family protein n=1 Tax=Salsuginibacillus kocurii TaxID=427078 RepID=UPI000363190C|nr:anti-sigma factor [Salsuginibacillus kocurii]